MRYMDSKMACRFSLFKEDIACSLLKKFYIISIPNPSITCLGFWVIEILSPFDEILKAVSLIAL